jgi:hypothetical protein
MDPDLITIETTRRSGAKLPEDPTAATGAARLLQEGLREAAAIGHPVARARHRAAWAFRLSRMDPESASQMHSELSDDPSMAVHLLLTVTDDRLRRGDVELEPHFSNALHLARGADPETRVRTLNALSEAAIELSERDRDAALELVRKLVPDVDHLRELGSENPQPQALAAALVGEALLLLGDAEGVRLLANAQELIEESPARDPILAFVAGALSERDPARALSIVATMQDPQVRMDARLQLAGRIDDPAVRSGLLDEAEADAALVEHWRGPEALVRFAAGLAGLDPDRARQLFRRALESSAAGSTPQFRSLQMAGVASAITTFDRGWAAQIFEQAARAALEDEEQVKRVTSLAVISNEMAESHPREAAELFARAIDEAAGLEAMWEHAHVLDIIFRSDRSPYLDVTPARALLEQVLLRISDEDPRVPGVFGLPEVARLMLEVDPNRAVEVLQRWLSAAESAADSDSMTQAAVLICRVDPEAGKQALVRAREYLAQRVDCLAFGEFSRAAAPVAPELVLELAPQIPDRRERADAIAAAAVALHGQDPEQALSLLRSLERPADRSSALLRLVDDLLGTGDRLQPQPLLEEMP